MIESTKSIHIMTTFDLHIVTVTKALFEGEAVEFHCTGVEGDMTILAKHEPFITKLKEGVVRAVTAGGESREFKVSDGVLEVASNQVVVLCSTQHG